MPPSPDRRIFFARVARSVVSTLCDAVDVARLAAGAGGTDAMAAPPESAPNSPVRPWIRPPGALPEAAFGPACTKCTACQEACPYQSIRRLGPEWDVDAGTPAVIPLESPCYLCEDMPCIAACEPGALQPVDRRDARMGTAVLRRDACYVAQGQPCDYCVARCPLRGEAIRFGPDRLPVIDAAHCTGCGVCAYLCPGGAIDCVAAGD